MGVLVTPMHANKAVLTLLCSPLSSLFTGTSVIRYIAQVPVAWKGSEGSVAAAWLGQGWGRLVSASLIRVLPPALHIC